MYKLANGWTKESVMEQVKKYNNGTRSSKGTGLCVYQGEDNNRCAIGCFIPDGHPGLKYEGAVSLLLNAYPDLRKHMPFDDIGDLQAFQAAHDLSPTAQVHEFIRVFLDKIV